MLKFCSILLATNPKERIQALYDCFAPFYFILHPFVRNIAKKATAILENGQGAKALDVCTGTGVVAEELARRGYKAAGIDLSLSMLLQRRKSRKQAGIQNMGMDARHLAFADNSFEICTISMGLHEFSREDRRQILSEMCRVSRKHILVADYSGKQSWPIRVAEWLEASHFKDFTDGSLGDQLAEMGLHIEKHEQWFSLGIYLCRLNESNENRIT